MKKITILTGAGAIVGAKFYKNFIKSYVFDNIQDKDFPFVSLINFPFKSTGINGLDNKDIFSEEINACLKHTVDSNVLLLLCFSMHNRFNSVYKNSNFLDITEIVKNKIKKPTKTLMLCSETSKHDLIFGEDLNYLNNDDYYVLNNVIKEIIEGKSPDLSLLKEIVVKTIKDKKIEEIVLGCTELFYSNLEHELINIKVLNPEQEIIKEIKEKTK